MVDTKSKPHFSIHLLSPEKTFQWCIAINGEVIHHIADISHFSKDIGYPDLHHQIINNKVASSDKIEIINNDSEIDTCSQNKIAVYSFENCADFKKEYGKYYASVIEECKARSTSANDRCEDCYITKVHPQTVPS